MKIRLPKWLKFGKPPEEVPVLEAPKPIVYDTKIINIFGGPGIGKSTVAARLFCELKMMGKDVELVQEYAKDMVWENRSNILEDQLYIFAKQHRRLKRLVGKVEYIVTDSPITLGIEYMEEGNFESLKPLMLEAHNSFNNANYMLNRQTKYNTIGRYHSEEQARELDEAFVKMLTDYQFPFVYVDTKDENAHTLILDDLRIR